MSELIDLKWLITTVIGALVAFAFWNIKSIVSRVDAKLDTLAAKDEAHSIAIVELRVKSDSQAADIASIKKKQDDFGGFLQTMGFKKSDG